MALSKISAKLRSQGLIPGTREYRNAYQKEYTLRNREKVYLIRKRYQLKLSK